VCGLYGVLNRGMSRDRTAIMLAVLAHANDDRGGHSWGVYVPNAHRIIKGLGKAITLDGGLDAASIADQPAVLGHARWATHGERTIENAHPFVIEAPDRTIVGAHNGVLGNHTELNTLYGRDFAVDSMHIFANIAHDLPLEDIQGGGAITYMTSEYADNRVYLGRFNGGSLAVFAIGSVKDPLALVWSSLPAPIELAAKLACVPIERYNIEENKLYYARAEGLYVTEIPFVFGRRQYTGTGSSAGYAKSYGHSYGWQDGQTAYDRSRTSQSTSANRSNSTSTAALDKARDAIIGDEDDTLPPRPTAAADRQLALVGRNGGEIVGASGGPSGAQQRITDEMPDNYLDRQYPAPCEYCGAATYASQAMVDEDFVICERCDLDEALLCKGCRAEVDLSELDALKLDPSDGDPILCQYCLTAWIFYANQATGAEDAIPESPAPEIDDDPEDAKNELDEALERRMQEILDDESPATTH
jgi:hypothetical protein